MNFGAINIQSCVNVVAPPDPRCDDPAFSLANPSICSTSSTVLPKLIVKPGQALTCQLGSIQFKAFWVVGGVETDVTTQAMWTTSDPTVALVGVVSGNATGVGAGNASVTASYNGKTASGNLHVLLGKNCCTAERVAMLVLVDATRSMSQRFDNNYPTRLDFAKAAATRFINEVNAQKDLVGLMEFDSTGFNLLAAPTSDTASVAALVPAIGQTQSKTEFYDAIQGAIAELNTVSADLLVLVLISDGEDTLTGTFTQSNDPIVLCNTFKDQGGIVIVLGDRASGLGYGLLSAMATGGFFINATPATEQQALDYLSGLKGYICAGNCTPQGDKITHQGALVYETFLNWDVGIGGIVDLIGNGFFDVLPGNGLYAHFVAFPIAGGGPDPTLTSKTVFTVTAGHSYRISVKLAGNQSNQCIPPQPSFTFVVKAINPVTNIDWFEGSVVINNPAQPFQTYSFNFTASHSGTMQILLTQPSADTNVQQLPPRTCWGVMLKEVRLDDTTDTVLLLDDTFDEENPVYVPPRCGIGTTFIPGFGYYVGTGYGCDGVGCLDSPPVGQAPDPNPLPNIESGQVGPPPTQFTSTKTQCATCPVGTPDPNKPLIPAMTSNTLPSGVASASGSANTSAPFNAFDQSSIGWVSANGLPQWIQYQFPSAVLIAGYSVSGGVSAEPYSWQLQGSNDGSTWTVLDVEPIGVPSVPGMTPGFIPLTPPGAFSYYRMYATAVRDVSPFVQLAFQLFGGTAAQACKSATATSNVSQADADNQANAAALAAATADLSCLSAFTSTQQATAYCPVGTFGNPNSITKSYTATSLISLANAQAVATANAQALAQAALTCTGDNSGDVITMGSGGAGGAQPASPYPSVKRVTGFVGNISKVTVAINALAYTFPNDILMLLVSPTGQNCLLMAHVGNGNAITGVNLVFDDAAGSGLPLTTGPIVSGTYKPTQHAPIPALAPPAPGLSYGTTLSVFNGHSPNGSWALWICTDTPGDSGQINGTPPWTLTII